jgi:hypothetical protein
VGSFDDTYAHSSVYELEDAEQDTIALLSVIESIRKRILNAREDLLYSDLGGFRQNKYASNLDGMIKNMNYLISKLGIVEDGLFDVPIRLREVYSALQGTLTEIEDESVEVSK